MVKKETKGKNKGEEQGEDKGKNKGEDAPATEIRDACPFPNTSFNESCTPGRDPPVSALRRVLRSVEVHGPSVSLSGRKIVYGSPESIRLSSAFLLYVKTSVGWQAASTVSSRPLYKTGALQGRLHCSDVLAMQ